MWMAWHIVQLAAPGKGVGLGSQNPVGGMGRTPHCPLFNLRGSFWLLSQPTNTPKGPCSTLTAAALMRGHPCNLL